MNIREFNERSFFSTFPVIELGDILLRSFHKNDTKSYFDIISDPMVNQFESDEDVPKNIFEATRDIEFWSSIFYKKRSIYWAIESLDKKNHLGEGEMIGVIGFNSWNISNCRGEVSYNLKQSYWNRGIMTKVLTNVVSFAFQKMSLNRIEAKTMLHNERSQRLLKKIGFNEDCVLKAYRVIRNKSTDIRLYSMISSDHFTSHIC